jgi:hypothetical protein
MKNIVKILFLLGILNQSLLGEFSITYKLDPDATTEFNSTQDPPWDAYYVVGVTTIPVLLDGNESNQTWLEHEAQLNPVFKFNSSAITDLFGTGSTVSTDARYAITSIPSEGNTGNVTYKEVILQTDTNYQYSGKPIVFNLYAFASNSGDYKGDTYQNGEVVMRYFPVLDIEQVDSQGIYIEALYKTDGNWTKCNSSDMVIDSAGIQYEDINGSNKSQIWGDLNDTYPVELTWNAKQGLPNFDGNITMRVQIKYGQSAFDTNSTSGSGGS